MATKLQLISELSKSTSKQLSGYDNWTAFLRSAAWQYKYPFEDQLLIFAQRPDAKACADFDTWNEKLHRRIKRGAKGIALLREGNRGYYLDYVFDVSDTHRHINGIDINLWQYNDRFDDAIIETLENTFGELQVTTTLTDAIICAAHNAVEDNKTDYLSELKYAKYGSFLEDLDELNIDVEFQRTVESSVAYMVMERLGLSPAEVFDDGEFRHIVDFSTPETISVLGNAVSSISEQALREISATISAEIKKEKNQAKIFAETEKAQYNETKEVQYTDNDTERNETYDENQLQNGERNTDSELGSAEDDDRADRQIRTDAQAVPETEQTQPILGNDDTGNPPGASVGDRQDSEGTSRADDFTDGESRGTDGTVQSGEPATVGWSYEQPQTFRRRGSRQTLDSQLSLFDLIENEDVADSMAREAERLSFRPAFSIPQEVIDVVLADGGNRKNSKLRICTQYEKQRPLEENVTFLKKEYGTGGKGFIINSSNVSAWFDDGGIKIQYGNENTHTDYTLTWEKAAQRIGELLDLGRYMPQTELDKVSENERYEIAYWLWDYFNNGELDEFEGPGGHPADMERMTAALADVDIRNEIIDIVHKTYASGKEFPRYYIKPVEEAITALDELNIPRKIFTAAEYAPFESTRFITQNEVDTVLAHGSGISEGKMRILSHFLREADHKKRADFLKNEYGIGGGSLYSVDGGWQSHDSKGLEISRGDLSKPYSKVTLSWSQVEKRIDFLVRNGRYATNEDIAYMTEYEKNQVARSVYTAFSNVPIERYSPFPNGFDYSDAVPIVRKTLDDADKTAEMLKELKALLMETPSDDRYYKYREEAANALESYVNGTYNLFPGIERPKPAQQSELDEAMRVINRYVKEEFDSESADYEDLRAVSLAFTSTEDGEHNIEVNVNLIEFSVLKYVDKTLVEEIKYDTLSELITNELEGMSFDDLVYLTDEQLAPFYEPKEQPIMEFYNELHKDDDGETVALFPVGDFYEIYGIDAEKAASILGLTLTAKTIDGYGYAMCGFPKHVLESYVDKLTYGGFDVILTDEDRKAYKILSSEKALATTEAENAAPEEQEPAAVNALVGKELIIDDRKFIVDSVDDVSGSASLKDITFENGTGFPIFRRESVEFVKAHLEIEEKADEVITPAFDMPKPTKVENTVVYPEIPMSERRNFVIDNDELGYGGPKEKFRKNMEAIRVLKKCESERRLATPEEQAILSEYVGWGGLADAFDESKPNWANEFQELYAALTPEEYTQARASTLNAHYTSPVIIKSMYKALGNMGFEQGNILEPSCGIGNFMGLVPDSMSLSKIYGIEIDSITGRIAQQLYQKNSVAIQGFEDTTLPDSFFDVAIGNVPFGDYKLLDKKYNKHNFLIHDYFFAKTLDKVRPGGIVAFITSSGTMDKQNSNIRKYIAQRADLVGAIRLPNNAFKANAGTEVTADILFLQKRDKMTDIMPDWVHLGTLENGITVNQYFADNPDMILGEMQMVSGPFGPTPTCEPDTETTLAEQLDDAIQNIHATITEYEYEDISNDEDLSIPADPNVKNFSYTVVDGNIYFRENSIMRKVEMNSTAENRIKGMIGIRDCVRELIEYQTEGYSDADIKAQQEKLNTLYDDYTKKYGLINSRGNAMAFSDDSSYFLLCSLEVLDENGELERKADMFTKRTIGAKTEITNVDTASEALAVSLGEKARIDIEFMSSLSGKSEEELCEELQGVIFLNPLYDDYSVGHEKYLTADEYLSGNVRNKLRIAKEKAEEHPEFAPNVEALTRVQPQDLTASEITVRLGSTWIPPEYIKQFTFELLETSYYSRSRIDVKYSDISGEWMILGKSVDKGVKATNTYGTKRINAYKIIEETLNLKDVRIFDYVEDEEGRKKPVLNKKETTIAQQKQDLIKAAFDDWIWKSPERREVLTRMYNERFNSTRPREYDGSHITFSGMNPEIALRQHQKNAVARIMYGGNSLLGHVVGAGKTWTMVAAAMEGKRLGLCNKSLFVVPNHLTEQWAAEFLQLYPAANILVATKKDFETKNRKKFCGRIATGDYDAVIIGHSQFEKIPMSAERQKAILERQLDEVLEGIMEAKESNAERYTVKQLVKTQRSLETKLAKLNDQSRKDDVVTFEELGVDRVFVDEAHYYKNLFLYTKMRNVGGIAQTEAQKSSDLFMKTQYLDEITGGKGVIFATGTPVSNSMVELYTMQRYLQYNTLCKNHLQHFDAWASTFGETITAIELAPDGSGYRAKTRFAKFFNLPELMAMFKEVADIQTADILNLPTPTPHYKTIAVEPTEVQKEMVGDLADRAERVRNKMVDPTVDNMLKITNDGRKLALDQRLINPLLPDDENSKVSACAREIFEIWQETTAIRGTQLVFCDLSTPKNDGTFNVYTDIKEKLIANGIPESEIEFIHDADTEVKKKELFSRVRKGDVRVLLGSTPKMGAGTNVQRLLYASHDLDCPWRPADLEQRAGRIIRQGNTNPDVHIRRYVTKDTFDSYMWQLVENKQKFISQIMTSKSPVRSAEDIDETALSYAEIKALATGNPHIKEKMDLDTQVAKLKLIKASFMSQKYELEDKVIKYYPKKIAELTEHIKGFETDIAVVAQHPKQEDKFYPMTIDGLGYYEKDKAGEALIERCRLQKTPEPTPIGDYRGFSMELSFEYSKFYVTLKGILSHKVELGADVFGNIQRLDNALEALPKRLEATRENLEETERQFEMAKVESQKEFPQEAELAEKLERLAVVDALLNMDKHDREGADLGEPDEDMDAPDKSKKEMER